MKTLHTKIIITLAICMIVSLLAVFITDYFYLDQLLTKNAELELQSASKELSTDIDAKVLGIEQSTNATYHYARELLDQRPDILNTDAGIEEYSNAVKLLAKSQAEYTYGASTSYLDLNPFKYGAQKGFFLTRKSLDERFVTTTMTDITAYSEFDLEHVGWYYVPIKSGEAIWMSPYYNSNLNIWMTSYVIPMFEDNGDPLGIVGMDLDFRIILDAVENAYVYSENGSAALFEKDGTLLYQKDCPTVLGNDPEALKTEPVQYSESEKKSISELQSAARESALLGEAVPCTWRGELYQITGQTLENDMLLVAMVPDRDVQSPIWEHLVVCAGIAMAIMFLSVLIAVLVTRSITRPLRALADASHKISAGDMDVEIEATTKDEVGQLTEAFKNMLTELRERAAAMNHMAFTDPLTGIGNRAAYVDAVEHAKKAIDDGAADFTLGIFDLNRLKMINDTYGHESGDALIADASRALVAALGEDCAYRFGGDEFAAIITGEDHGDLDRWESRLCEAIAEINEGYTRGEGNLPGSDDRMKLEDERLSIAYGFATFDPEKHSSYQDLFDEADKKMYANKMANR